MSISLPFALHIPDGFLSGGVAAAAAVLAAAAVALALRVAGKELDEDRVPMLGLLAAFIFAVQMLNFPVAGGTSGHLLGATLAAVLLGPWLACLVMSVVITVQAFAFADGGITALGANVINMGVIGALLAGLVLGWALRSFAPNQTAFLGMVGVTAWLAVMLGATATSFQLAISGTVPLDTVLPAMLGVHALIGIGEAVITVAAISAVLATRPDLIGLARFGPGQLEGGGQPPPATAPAGGTAA
ncbi:MAG: energy-coupling factor ABC transporter permease [Actinomycetota bacterium]|nr:energy-coupling factor ABC transporter permease [Actinomycetota bacterium]